MVLILHFYFAILLSVSLFHLGDHLNIELEFNS